jgi:hypothetical protein
MIKSLSLLFAILLLMTSASFSKTEKCAAMSVYNNSVSKDPSIINKEMHIENQIQEYINSKSNKLQAGTILTIPVVIHIINNGEELGEGPNITDEQAISLITILNREYRLENTDALDDSHPFFEAQADCEIEFCLVNTDPDGNPTSGITRYNSGQEVWDIPVFDDVVKPATIWNPDKYLNIWCANFVDPDSEGDGVTDGYGTFPSESTDSTDGVAVLYTNFGVNPLYPDEKSIVASHEVGHYLNLRHIWGDEDCGDDFVDDTEPAFTSNEGCPDFPYNAFSECGSGENGEMYMNYMDYSDAVCVVMFTNGQKERMRATLNTVRSGLLSSNGCQAPAGIYDVNTSDEIKIVPNSNNGVFNLVSELADIVNCRVEVVDMYGTYIKGFELSSQNTIVDCSELSSGVYFLKIIGNKINQSKKLYITK